jgi:hypothetical protein
MIRWEYAMLSNPATGTDSVSFSRPQGGALVRELSQALGRGLKAEQSNPSFLHLNLNHTNMVLVSGVLGERGWELVGMSTLTGGHAYLMFKRQVHPV